jgi:hypothetical protein
MRVLVVHHGALVPPAGQPASGGALRARVHARALEEAGHEVLTLGRAQDEPGALPGPGRALRGFRAPAELRRRAQDAAVDRIVCVAPEEAGALAGIAPLCVDLYAPRMLEGAFEGLQEHEAGRTLEALRAADEVLFSNPRQRWFFLGLLGAAGWDLTTTAGRLVPLACVDEPGRTARLRPPATPYVIVGGQPWPWQDAGATLARAVRHLGFHADVRVVGLPAVTGATAVARGDRAGWLDLLAGSAAVLDRYAPNPERALAQSFRQMDALTAGAPLVTDPDTPLAEEVRATGAGWVDTPLEDALDAALAEATQPEAALRRRAAVHTLAARFAPARTEEPLLAWITEGTVRARSWNLLAPGAALARARDRAARAEARRDAALAEVADKRAEIEALNAQVRALAGAVEASAAALSDVAGFKREVAAVLGTRLSGREAEAEHLRRELAIAHAEIDKKTRELDAAQAERDRVGKVLRALRGG